MDLYKISYKEWNDTFSDLNFKQSLSVGISDEDAITRFKGTLCNLSNYKDFTATKIVSVCGHRVAIIE